MFISEDSQDSKPTYFFRFDQTLHNLSVKYRWRGWHIPSLISMSFNKVRNSVSLCFVYLELFYKPFQPFIYIIELVVVMNIAVIVLAGC